MIRTCSFVKDRRGTFVACLVLAAMAALPMPAWGQWNGTNPVWTNSNVGIGTSNPGGGYTYTPILDTNGSVGVRGDLYLLRGSSPYVGSQDAYDLRLGAALTERMRITTGGNVGIGTTTPQYKLAVNGNIGAQDIIVTNTGWSDYVFKPGYRLRPLSEVSEFIQANGHLPGIPTEADVKEKGVSVGDMQAKLLAKVEELTLHMIQQEKENRELRERLARLEKVAATDSTLASGK